jgi:predicted nucleic acid-binding protein
MGVGLLRGVASPLNQAIHQPVYHCLYLALAPRKAPALLTAEQCLQRVLEDLLRWCQSWIAAIPSSLHRVCEPHDQVFLNLTLATATLVLVTGDFDLLALQATVLTFQIITTADFQSWLPANT